MRRIPRALKASLVAGVLLVGACGGNGSTLAGTYDCGPEPATGQAHETWELREDGTLSRSGPAPEGTWSTEGDSLIVTFDGQEDRFAIQEAGFASTGLTGPPGEQFRWVCTRTTQ
jgi:hypothetical protein